MSEGSVQNPHKFEDIRGLIPASLLMCPDSGGGSELNQRGKP
jgi:hypothetical protein